jgi:hypothetical protein
MDDPGWSTLDTFLITFSNVVGGVLYLIARRKERVIQNLQVRSEA